MSNNHLLNHINTIQPETYFNLITADTLNRYDSYCNTDSIVQFMKLKKNKYINKRMVFYDHNSSNLT